MSSREARLVFDSARSCATVGQRAGMRVDRSLMFQAGDYSVDIVLNAGLSEWGYVYGQVVQHADGTPVAGAAVRFEDDDSSVRTDELGQFALGVSVPDARQVLRVETRAGAVLCTIPSVDEASEH